MEVNLFSPLKIKNLLISNRIVMPSMALDHGTEAGEVTEKVLKHYSKRAERNRKTAVGVGLIIVEHAYVSPKGRVHPRQLGIYSDNLLPGLKELVQEIKQQGAVVGIQLSHGGGRALAAAVAPSGFRSPYLQRFEQNSDEGEVPRELTLKEMNCLADDFSIAAERALAAGFDLIELHGAHGYLLNQFYSPLTNHRQDDYGGALKKRLRFALEIIEKVKAKVGKTMPLFYRLGADDRLPGGNSIEDSIQAAIMLEEAGVDCLDLSGGLCGYLKEGPEGFFVYMAEAIKPAVNIPIMVTGGIRDPITANQIITKNKADLIGVGRTLLKEPEWGLRAWEKLTENKIL